MVNTFLPYASFSRTAKVLDRQRLGKQRVEAKQIINILSTKNYKGGWANHPAVNMWRGYLPALKLYYNTIIREWVAQGYVNRMSLFRIQAKPKMPWFVGNETFHASHRASLLRKNPQHYRQFFTAPEKFKKYSYVWPGKLTEGQIKELKKFRTSILDISKYAQRVSKLR